MNLLPPRNTAAFLAAAAFSLACLCPAAPAQDAVPAKAGQIPAPAVDLHTQKTLYVVPYAHLDTQWRWSYPQVIREFLADTLHKNFALLDKYPHYVFNFSGSRRYEMMHEYYPEDWERLKGYIKEGRWFPCGSSVDEDDANVPGLESMVRHVLYGNHYFAREFGVTSAEFMLPDCFGFPASLPTILTHCGIRGFSTQKRTWGSAAGIPFKIGNWGGPDGSPLAAALDPGSYGGGVKEDLSQNQSWLARIDKTGAQSGLFADYHYYGTGDRGGSPDEKSVAMMEKNVVATGPVHVLSATAEQMFLDLPADARERLPRYQGDLLLTEHSAGSITSQAYMKRWNRKNELLADAAERAAVAAAWLGGAPYPAKKLYDAWDLMLGSQMHDMLPGTSLPKAYEYCWNDDVLAANQFAAVEQDSVGAVTSALDTQAGAGGTPLVVYNPLSLPREDVAEGSVTSTDPAADVQVLGPDGKETPVQVTRRADGKIDFLFLASVPPVSFTTYEARTLPAGSTRAVAPALLGVDHKLENARYRVAVNADGDVASIFDKQANRELLAAPLRLEFHQENPRQFPAWNMDWADRQKPARGYVDGPAAGRVVEPGPGRATREIERRAEGARFVSRVSLAAGGAGDAVEFHDRIDWNTREACLKAAFLFTVSNPLAAYDDKVGVVMRGNNDPKKYEVPQHEWFDLTDKDDSYGVRVLTDCKFGSDTPDAHTLRLTLLYTPGVRGEYQDQATQDFGRHDMAYAVTGHPGGWQQGGTVARGHRLNQPLRVFTAPAHPGALGRVFSLASLDNAQVEIVALKKAEDSDETIVRLRELGGQAPQTVHLRFAAPVSAVRAVDGQERPLGNTSAAEELRDGQITTKLVPYGLRTLALKFAPPAVAVEPPTTMPVSLPFDEDVISTRANRSDGRFETEGGTFPAEGLPATIVSEGIPFQMGPMADGQKNALSCRGQTIPLPAGDYDRVVLLAAADGDTALGNGDGFDLRPAGNPTNPEVTVPDWSGYLGQWDNRLWKGKVPELTYTWSNPPSGLVPGFVKTGTVAWYCSHRHERGGDGVYQYSYLFKYSFELSGSRRLVLPNKPGIRLFAVTAVGHSHDAVQAARPLSDTFSDHVSGAAADFASRPAISPPAPREPSSDALTVTIAPPFYWQEEGLRYTLDGSEPTESSPLYTGPIALHASTTLKTRMFLPGHSEGGLVETAFYPIEDRTAPSLVSASVSTLVPQLYAVFSEPVDKASAEAVDHYHLEPSDVSIRSAKVSEDGLGVVLQLTAPLSEETSYLLVAGGIRDLSPAGNVATRTEHALALASPAFYLPDIVVCDGKRSRSLRVAGLPVGARDPWTINFYAYTTRQPENRTLLAGFGSTADNSGQARYLSKFANGIHFWSSDQDGETTTALDLDRWQMLTATYDGGTLRLYKNAVRIGEAQVQLEPDESVVNIAPQEPWDQKRRFQGEIAGVSIWKEALAPEMLALLLKGVPPR